MNIPRLRSAALLVGVLQVALGLLLTRPLGSATAADSLGADKARVIGAYGKLPLSFEANRGQTDKRVEFLSRGPGYVLFLTPTKAVMSLKTGGGEQATKDSGWPVSPGSKGSPSKADVLRIRLEHANGNTKVSGIDELTGKSDYFIGKNPAKWQSNISTFARVKYRQVYSGVDLVFYGNQRRLEYDFVLAPEADPRQIELGFDGAKRLRLDADGNLIGASLGATLLDMHPSSTRISTVIGGG